MVPTMFSYIFSLYLALLLCSAAAALLSHYHLVLQFLRVLFHVSLSDCPLMPVSNRKSTALVGPSISLPSAGVWQSFLEEI